MAESGASPDSPLARAARFVWLTARVLEQRRFAFHFQEGGADPVDAALAAYANEDGGFGGALEPDLRGPASQPLHGAHALRVLDSIGRCAGPRIERLCAYLTAVSAPDGALPALLPSQRGYPSTPSIPVLDHPPSALLATGPVVGLLHRNEVWHAWLFRATDFCWAAVERWDGSHPDEVTAAVDFLDGVPDRARAEAAADRLGRLVRARRLVSLDPDHIETAPPAPGYTPDRHLLAHDVARTPASLARSWFTGAELERSLDHLEGQQHEDGGWPARGPLWAPGVHLESRSIATVEALRTLRAHGRPVV
ncbi:hypothetical protein [Streptomyces tsukubensis]|uniref:Prenyltransferase n=1 Tax=Streptomyces tsukubensis TaxID=83656 RepID=A0A1V4A0G4_9ACTN|nr:hypothetical protein [Streptomyces tsukubensis]OON71705.1 hypothetical protein B1H18_32830 [Streptomyces tsukubensis]QFR96065.1 hypothetical protein GBW32_27230 [Streptomyces tsukubensis]